MMQEQRVMLTRPVVATSHLLHWLFRSSGPMSAASPSFWDCDIPYGVGVIRGHSWYRRLQQMVSFWCLPFEVVFPLRIEPGFYGCLEADESFQIVAVNLHGRENNGSASVPAVGALTAIFTPPVIHRS